MYVCQWHLNTPFGKQREVVRIVVPGSQRWEIDGVPGGDAAR
ncbi:MAG TPA: hypothetical protein VNH46_13440 [Gemmatimonadales bacterium]|nr:hypothetical protein [Gemmatimonadales bacterium]